MVAAVIVAVQICAGACRAEPGLPEKSTVAVARTDQIMIREGLLAPEWLYPEGRIDYGAIERLLRRAVATSVGTEKASDAWKQLLNPTDRVGIQFDVQGIRPHDALLEALIRQIMDAGVPMRNIVIYAGDEAALYRAGFDLSGRAPGVRVMASDDQGYRHGISRIVLDLCTKIVNLSRLRVDSDLAVYGSLTNCLASVPYVERERTRRDPPHLAEAAGSATLRRKTVLHIVDALQPGYRRTDDGKSFETWFYRGVLASQDPVAIDVVGRDILNEKRASVTETTCEPLTVQYLEPASRHRLGNSSPDRIEVIRAEALTD